MTDPITRLTTALADRYVIERELGAGGMATVYLAHDVRHDRKVALKVLRPELSAILGGERFLAEIKTTANLQHPHILSLFDSGEADGLVFYVMPYVEGESLRERLTREKQLPVEDAVRIAREVADALDYAHRHGVVHRDIKPENILLHGGHAMVADFGIALAASRSDGGSRMTETGMSLGTPHYMAPEQAMGEREITPKADIYALGCVLYEMLTAEPPFVGATAQAIIARVMTEEPRSLTLQRKTIPPHIEAAVTMALAKLPADRFATAAQFGEALGRADFALPRTRGMPAGAGSRARRLPAFTPWVVAALAAGVALFAWLRPSPRADVLRFGVVLPDSVGVRTDHNGNSLALSPDGSKLVYVGAESHMGRQLYVRELGQLLPRALPGTGGAEAPFFSPDGEWVAFFADGRLKKVALAGGPPLTIADANTGRGGTWGEGDRIVFNPTTTSPLLSVSAAGGPVDTLTRLRADSGEASHRWPEFLPGSRAVVFTVQYQGGVRYRIMALDLRTRVVKPLIDEATNARYVPTRHLVYASDAGALLAVPFEPRRLTVMGSPVSLLEGMMVKPLSGAAEFAVSRSGTLAYLTGAAAKRALVMVDRGGTEAPLGDMVALQSPRFSPDGRRIALSSTEGRSSDVRVLDLQRHTLSRLTFEGNNLYPEWTPDGRRVGFYAVQRPGAQGTDLYWTAADGSGAAQPILTAPGNQLEMSWAPGGRSLVFRQIGLASGKGELWILPVDSPRTPRPYLQTAFNEYAPALSPDGHWIAYGSDESGRPEVYVRSFPEPTGRWQISVNGGIMPRWAHSGREIFYRSGDSLISVAVTTRPAFTVGQRKVLFVRPYFGIASHTQYDVSPNDRQFVMVREGSERPGLVVALNWFEELRRRSASGAPAAPR